MEQEDWKEEGKGEWDRKPKQESERPREQGQEQEHRPGLWQRIMSGRKPGKDQFLIFILAGILLIVIALPTSGKTSESASKSGLWDSDSDTIEAKEAQEASPSLSDTLTGKKTQTEEYEAYLENKLEQIISAMEGAGRVRVIVTVGSSDERVVAKDVPTVRNSTTETDAQGGSRSVEELDTQEETVYTKESDGSQEPYVTKTVRPQPKGVVVVAEGADRPEVIRNIIGAVEVLFDMEPHKIKVVKMKSE